MPAYERALAECFRVLKPDGLFIALVWQGPDKAPLLGTVIIGA